MGSSPAAYEREYDSFSTALPNYEIISFLCLKNQMLVVMGRIWDLENIEALLLTTLQNYGYVIHSEVWRPIQPLPLCFFSGEQEHGSSKSENAFPGD